MMQNGDCPWNRCFLIRIIAWNLKQLASRA
jgi:hypothetical protein